MTDEKLRKVIDLYRTLFKEAAIDKNKHSRNQKFSERKLAFEHCHAMLDDMEQFLDEGRRDKVFRWLGFIQGVLFCNKIFTIEQLALHNKIE